MFLSVSKKRTALIIVALMHVSFPALAQGQCQEPAGRFASIEGQIQLRTDEKQAWHPAKLDDQLCNGDTIRVGEKSRAAIVLANEAVMRLDQNTTMRLVDISGKAEEKSWIELLKGAIQSFSRKPRLLSVNTPYLNGSIEGTEFQVRVEEDRASLLVLEGRVVTSNEQGKVAVNSGEIAEALAGKAPTARTVVRPRDAVQWALYYPPIQAGSAPQADSTSPLQQAIRYTNQGDTAAAFAALNQVAETERDAAYYSYRSSLLLSVGRQDEALDDIEAALQRDPKAGLAHALRAIVHVVQNERDQALAEAGKGVSLSDTAATRIALSYAQQADFRIEAARDTLLTAVRNDPEDALAWARLSEVWLMLGEKEQSRMAAAKSASLAPDLARTQSVLGFAALAEYRDSDARASFQRAIELSPSDPLAHLGMGLAQISGGELQKGRQELEVAVALDSSQALLRSYLGKAYFEERRSTLDAQQFDIAKSLDPLDPTAFLYDGIRKQTENRPVEALADLEQSMALNDNRAVYRGRLLLDKDRAARGSSLARVYNDLGFRQIGINESTQSLAIDPGNESAHRFLSDSYRDSRNRTGIARVSELLQAQMLQDSNINPIQPSVGATNLNIVTLGGPSTPGFNEFTPLFEQNRIQVNGTGTLGSNDTRGAEAAVSGIHDHLSFSVGGFTYDTDGFRDNNDISHDIVDVYGQWAVLPTLNLQTEYSHRDTKHGDLEQNFDLNDFDPNFRRTDDEDLFRLGARLSPDQQSSVLLSFIHSDTDSTGETSFEIIDPALPLPIGVAEDQTQEDDANQYEAQYQFHHERFNVVTGGAYTNIDTDANLLVMTDLFFLPVPDVQSFSLDSEVDDYRGYVYANIDMLSSVVGTVGTSYQDYDDGLIDTSEVNPKLGVRWAINDQLTLRSAWFKAFKPALAGNRLLEPTQVSGFNQYYDDADATKSTNYGIALDWKPLQSFHVGTELTRRELESPVIDLAFRQADYEDRDEWNYRGYAYWTPSNRWALSMEGVFDKFENTGNSDAAFSVPSQVDTYSLPVKATWFHPSGFFGTVGVTYVDQEVQREAISSLAQGKSNFSVVDAGIGFRLPKRHGIFTLSVQNLLDESFDYQDDGYRTFGDQPYVGPYAAERTVMVQISVSLP